MAMLVRGALRRDRRTMPSAPPSPDDHPSRIAESNARLLLLEAVGGAILNAAISFNAVYAVRLGATSAQIGLLAALPSLVVVLMTIPIGRYLERLTNLAPFAARSVLTHRLLYLLLVLVPFAPEAARPYLLVAAIAAAAIPAGAFGLAFTALFADLIPDKKRAIALSWRQIVLSVASLVIVPSAGLWLNQAAFPMNYQVLYGLAAVIGFASFVAISRVRPDPTATRAKSTASVSFRPRAFVESMRAQPGFVRIVVNTLVHGLGVWIAGPLYVLLFVRDMGAPESWFGLYTAIAGGASALGYYLWPRGISRLGDRRALILSTTLTGLNPALIALAPTLDVALGLALIQGLLLPALGLSHFSTLLRVCPDDQRPTYLAIYTVIMNAGAFASPLISVAIADATGIRPVLLVAGALWTFSGFLFWRLPPEEADPRPTAAPAA